MQDPPPVGDLALEAVARRLAATPPRLTPADRDRLLYECGVAAGRECGLAAGRRAAAKSVLLWRVAAAASLAAMVVGSGVLSTARRETPVVERVSANPAIAARTFSSSQPRGVSERGHVLRAGASWDLARLLLDDAPNREPDLATSQPAPLPRAKLSVGNAWSQRELWE